MMSDLMKRTFNRIRNQVRYGDSDYDPVYFLVFEELRLVLLLPSKVACTSIKAAVGEGLGIRHQSSSGLDIHADPRWHKVFGGIPKRFRDYFYAAFVRHPLSRFVSCYQDRVLFTPGGDDFKQYYFERYPFTIPPNCSFEEFVGIVERIKDPVADRHFKQQSHSLSKAHKDPDFLGRFENLTADWRWLATRFGFPATLPKLNRTDRHVHRVAGDWKDFYTPALQARVAARYSRDLEQLGYDAGVDAPALRVA
jgi:hypothetical protein